MYMKSSAPVRRSPLPGRHHRRGHAHRGGSGLGSQIYIVLSFSQFLLYHLQTWHTYYNDAPTVYVSCQQRSKDMKGKKNTLIYIYSKYSSTLVILAAGMKAWCRQ